MHIFMRDDTITLPFPPPYVQTRMSRYMYVHVRRASQGYYAVWAAAFHWGKARGIPHRWSYDYNFNFISQCVTGKLYRSRSTRGNVKKSLHPSILLAPPPLPSQPLLWLQDPQRHRGLYPCEFNAGTGGGPGACRIVINQLILADSRKKNRAEMTNLHQAISHITNRGINSSN